MPRNVDTGSCFSQTAFFPILKMHCPKQIKTLSSKWSDTGVPAVVGKDPGYVFPNLVFI